MNENRNTYLAFGLSFLVIVLWYIFVLGPQQEAERQRQLAARQQQVATQSESVQAPGSAEVGSPQAPTADGTPQLPSTAPAEPATAPASRTAAVNGTSRVKVATPSLSGSINLVGGRIDDLLLNDYHETVDPSSPKIVLFSPSNAPNAYYAEFGWVPAQGALELPGKSTEWRQVGSGDLTPDSPITLEWSNGAGLTFQRVYEVDKDYLFSIKETVSNTGEEAVTIHPFGLVSRHGRPESSGMWILHEGMIGVFGDEGLEEVSYGDLEDDGKVSFPKVADAWLGITDKYWAAALVPSDGLVSPRYVSGKTASGVTTYQADYLGDGITIEAGGQAETLSRLFAGAKEVAIIDDYEAAFGIDRFDRLIDWGWFYFLTKPMFLALDFFYHLVGNFGVSILIVTVIVKLIFFPLANRAYASMSKMKKLQPAMTELRERFKDDKQKQQQELMKLYQQEKVNPISGCLPMLIQIPVFFSLYKVLFVTIEMRHTPFFGWIVDLSAPDPTSLFNLFGLLPYTVPAILTIGVWPLIMGATMFVQMKLNPAPPDPTQQMIFNWMPVIFTVMLASFPAGLVIYWAWNNLLSVMQQAYIMRRHNVDVDLIGNIRSTFRRTPKDQKQPGE